MGILDEIKFKKMENLCRNAIGIHDRVLIDPADVIDLIEEIRYSNQLHSVVDFGDFND